MQVYTSLSARRVWIEISAVPDGSRNVRVTLCEESVDWNKDNSDKGCCQRMSLSARRVWIEIAQKSSITGCTTSLSARRVWIEIVKTKPRLRWITSLSARRVWIEISSLACRSWSTIVTLCEESVDWNRLEFASMYSGFGHSLRGECGLKSFWLQAEHSVMSLLSARRV